MVDSNCILIRMDHLSILVYKNSSLVTIAHNKLSVKMLRCDELPNLLITANVSMTGVTS